MCLQHGEFRGLHEASRNEMQTEVFFLVHLLGLDDPANKALNLRDKPDEDKRIDHVETGMESSQHKGQFDRAVGICHIVTQCIACPVHECHHSIHKRMEEDQNPDDTEYIEEHMSQCSPASLCIGRQGSQITGNSGSYILTKHQGNTLIDRQGTTATENHRDGHHGSR